MINILNKLKYIWFLFIFNFLLYGFAIAGYKTTNEEVVLTGKVGVRKFFDANNKIEKAFILTLDTPISVAKDEFDGPVNNVTEIQLVFLSNISDRKKYLNHEVEVKGVLFYAITAHHHIKVLMDVKTIRTLQQ
ncbi:MAG: DUF4431 domain-containing protein [Nitrospinota bacterium]